MWKHGYISVVAISWQARVHLCGLFTYVLIVHTAVWWCLFALCVLRRTSSVVPNALPTVIPWAQDNCLWQHQIALSPDPLWKERPVVLRDFSCHIVQGCSLSLSLSLRELESDCRMPYRCVYDISDCDTQALPSFKWWKAGQGLGTKLTNCPLNIHVVPRDFVAILNHTSPKFKLLEDSNPERFYFMSFLQGQCD